MVIATIGLIVLVGTFVAKLLSTIPLFTMLGPVGGMVGWVADYSFMLFPLGAFLLAYGLTRNAIASIVAAIMMALIMMTGVLPI